MFTMDQKTLNDLMWALKYLQQELEEHHSNEKGIDKDLLRINRIAAKITLNIVANSLLRKKKLKKKSRRV
jgi:hypothetical protein